jgi:hypothetical protein
MTRAADPEREHRHLTADELSATAESVRRGSAQPEPEDGGCEACREQVEDLLTVLDVLPRLERPALPQLVAIRLNAALEREAQQRAADGGAPVPARRRRFEVSLRLGWATAGLALVCIALSAVALGGVFSTASSPSAGSQATSGSGPAQNHPAIGVPSPVSSALAQSGVESSLGAWALSVLADPSDGVSTGKGPMVGTNSAASALAALCAGDPAYKSMTPIAEQQGIFDGVSAELIVYGTPGQTSGTAYAVAFALPCTTGAYRILAQGSVSY